jgi:prepilin-type N-terminal cleavage/methylation domain-containing protein
MTIITQMQIHRKHKQKSTRSGEAGSTLVEMIIVIVISSILGTFIFGVLTKCLVAQRDMQVRKERSDDAIQALERINREFREANVLYYAVTNYLIFQKRITSSADANLWIKYQRNTLNNTLVRYSASSYANILASTTGDTIATDITDFICSNNLNQKTKIVLAFDRGSDWETNIFRRNFGL